MPQTAKRRRRKVENPATYYGKKGFAKYVRKELEAQYKAEHRAKVQAFERQKGKVRADREKKLQAAREACRLNLELVRAEADRKWQGERIAALEKRRATKRAARLRCADKRSAIRQAARTKLEKLNKDQREERRFWREMKASERRTVQKARRRTAKEARQESDDEVRANIDPELLPYFEEIKRTIKGSPYMSRTEEFLHRVEEDPEALWAAREAAADEVLKQQLKEYYAEEAVPF